MTLHHTTLQRLSFAKYLYKLAIEQSRCPELQAASSDLTFHEAVEFFLQIATEYLNVGKDRLAFDQYWDALNPKIAGGALPQQQGMRRLNKAMVALKHHAVSHAIKIFRRQHLFSLIIALLIFNSVPAIMENKPPIKRKNIRLVASEPAAKPYIAPLTSIDLFCGAGGITQGFHQVGYQCLYANDLMPEAMETFRHNHPTTRAECKPIEDVKADVLRRLLGLQKGELDVLVGGPPCQGFSINAPNRFLHDPRNSLFKHYARFAEEFAPKAFVFENVPGLLSMADGAVFEKILQVFCELGYHLSVKILFGPHYGIAQERWRLILLGSKFGEIAHPLPTHFAKGRANFRGGSTLTFQLSAADAKRLASAVTVGDAIRDLPRLNMGEGAEELGYTTDVTSTYAMRLRNPDGITFNHFAAKLAKQNIERMQHVPPGGSWRDIPRDLLPLGMQKARTSDHTKRYGRLSFDGFSGTVLTKCDPHWGTVFLPDQDRTLSVREAARLQSFPDSYRFLGSRVSQYVQVGNAVPVMMATAIARAVRSYLESHHADGEMNVPAMAAHG